MHECMQILTFECVNFVFVHLLGRTSSVDEQSCQLRASSILPTDFESNSTEESDTTVS